MENIVATCNKAYCKQCRFLDYEIWIETGGFRLFGRRNPKPSDISEVHYHCNKVIKASRLRAHISGGLTCMLKLPDGRTIDSDAGFLDDPMVLIGFNIKRMNQNNDCSYFEEGVPKTKEIHYHDDY